MARNLYKRGRYYYFSFYIDRERFVGSTHCEYASEAQKVLRKVYAEALEGKRKPQKIKMSFYELCDDFLQWGEKHRKGCIRRDKIIVRHLKLFFGNIGIADLTPEKIESYMTARIELVKCSTVNREVETLRAIYNRAIRLNYIESNPASAEKISYYPEPPKTHRWIRPDEVKSLLNQCKGRLSHLYGVIMVAVHTGMRKSEIFNLKWKHIDFTNRRITVKHAKHHQNRYIPMNDDLIRVLKQLKKDDQQFVFTNQNGTRLTRVDKSLSTAVKNAGIAKCTLHDFRATWATELLASGEDIETVRQLGGWRDYTTILRYVEAIPERCQSALDKLVGKYD